MYFKLIKLVSGDLVLSKIHTENSKKIVLENPLTITISYDDEMRPVFKYLPWQILSESRTVELSMSSVLYTCAPKSELLTVYMNICTQFNGAPRASQTGTDVQSIETVLNSNVMDPA